MGAEFQRQAVIRKSVVAGNGGGVDCCRGHDTVAGWCCDAGVRAGITPQAVSTYINPPRGKSRLPKSNELYRMAAACGLSMEELLTGRKNAGDGPTEIARWRDRALLAEQKLSVVKAGLSGMLKKI